MLWIPAFLGVKPALIMKGGFIAGAPMGDPNASIPTPQPVHYRQMFGSFGSAPAKTSLTFVSKAAVDRDLPTELGLNRALVACHSVRSVTKKDMVHNDAMPVIEVSPETYEVTADGELLSCEPAEVLPMAQRYFLF